MPRGGRALAWGALAAYSALVFCISSLPIDAIPSIGFTLNDKLVHLKAYFGWGFICAWALRTTAPHFRPGMLVLGAALGGALYGLSDEIHQMFVPGRAAELGDLAADAAGATLGGCAWVGLRSALLRVSRSRPEAASAAATPGPLEREVSAPGSDGTRDGR